MKVKIHPLFQYLLETTKTDPEAILGFSLSSSPVLGDFLADLDPGLSLDWNGQSFRGLPSLRAAVTRQAGTEPVCTADQVLITAGAAEANYLAIRQLLHPGDEIVIESPGWPQAAVLARAIGAHIKTVTRQEQDGWALPLDALRDSVTPRTKLIFLTNPNNPTGALMSDADLNAVAGIADAVGAWLLVDEVYAGLEWEGPRPKSIAAIYPRGITTGSVSKALGLQGLRTGWMICQDETLLMDATILRENSSEIMNIMGETIAEIALRPGRLASALDKARGEGRANLDHLDSFISAQAGLTWIRPRAGLIGLARLPKEIMAEPFARRLLAAPYRTFLLPGTAYDHPHHIRLGVGGGAAVNLPLGLSRLKSLLDEESG